MVSIGNRKRDKTNFAAKYDAQPETRMLTITSIIFAFVTIVTNVDGVEKADIHRNTGWRKILSEARDQLNPTVVDYGANHPFELYKRRNLMDADFAVNDNMDAAYQPIRITFLTEPIESLRDQQNSREIDYILSEVLPTVQKTWSTFLSVFPVHGPIQINTSQDCFGVFEDDVFQQQPIINDADLVIVVSAKEALKFSGSNDELRICGESAGSTLAVASACNFDQWDRPIVGFINFCLSSTSGRRMMKGHRRRKLLEHSDGIVSEPVSQFDTRQVATHEVGHILGMDSDLFKYFRNAQTGEPLTPRPFQESEARCVDGSVQRIKLAAANTLRPGQTNRGIFYYSIVTPRVQQVVRNHFNCQSLLGARLENQPTGDTCVGSHWDELLFSSELMSPVFEDTKGGLTSLTLALLEDSGWYRVCYASADLSSYGFGLGCGFAESDCIVNGQVPQYGVFCDSPITDLPVDASSDELVVVCDPFHKSFGLCDLFDFNNDQIRMDVPMPANPITYFTNPGWIGTNQQRDFCPLPTISFNVDCTMDDPGRLPEYEGESQGPGNQCVNAFSRSSSGQKRVRPACMSLFCDKDDRKLYIGNEVCKNDGDLIAVKSNLPGQQNAMIECPRLTSVCPQLFCPGSCSARGTCNFETGLCECFDSDDTSEDCSGGKEIISCPLNFLYNEATRPPSRYPSLAPNSSGFQTGISAWSTLIATVLVTFAIATSQVTR